MKELLTLHRLNVPFELRRSLRSTNAIEALFSRVRFHVYEKGIKRYRSGSMTQRWLGTVLLQCERGFQKINRHRSIEAAKTSIVNYQQKFDRTSRAVD
jgi:hypothetical protein